jgi:phosphoribosylanthranilate isomerase
MVKVKICGITNLEDAEAAVEYGADALGFVFVSSPREVTIDQVTNIIASLPPFVIKVGVFFDDRMERIKEAIEVCGLDLVQLHGSESPEFCEVFAPRVIKGFRARDESVLSIITKYKVRACLLDSFDAEKKGGTGKTFDWDIARKAARDRRVILAGGLTPDNVSKAIKTVQPYAVDVSSGVENIPGKKDKEKLLAFIEAVKM